MESTAGNVTLYAGNLALLLILAAAALLQYHVRSYATLAFLIGMVILWSGSAIQLAAPIADFSYIKDGDEIVGATGGFPDAWYFGSIVFYVGMLTASIGLVFHAILDHQTKGDA